jgi:epoxyqueuosine reductase QueG
MSDGLIDQLRADARGCGIGAFGVCNLEELQEEYPTLLEDTPGGFTKALVFGIPVPEGCLAGITDSPTLAYFHHYRQLNYILDRYAVGAALSIERTGASALAVAASQVTSWHPVPKGHISHRLLAEAAGLGWRGRNNLLVTPEHGSRIRLVSVLTDVPLEVSNSPVEMSCGSCRACVAVCPAGAIRENPEDFDAQACSEKLREFSKIQFIGQRICGVCVKACGPRQSLQTEKV